MASKTMNQASVKVPGASVAAKRTAAAEERRQLLGIMDKLHQFRFEARQVSDHPEADAVLVQLAHFLFKSPDKQLHKERYFFGGAPPVLTAEREQRQIFDAEPVTGAHRAAHRLDPALMAGDARQEALLGPASIAIHDDGDVPRHLPRFRNLGG